MSDREMRKRAGLSVRTPEEEAMIESAEREHNRARIIERGVVGVLTSEIEIPYLPQFKACYEMLGEAIRLRESAYRKQRIAMGEPSGNARTAPKRKTKGRRANA